MIGQNFSDMNIGSWIWQTKDEDIDLNEVKSVVKHI